MNRPTLLLLVLLAACSTSTSPPSAPVPGPATEPPPPPEISTIVVPIQASLAPMLPLIEAQVPKGVTKTDAYELDPEGRFGIKYKVV